MDLFINLIKIITTIMSCNEHNKDRMSFRSSPNPTYFHPLLTPAPDDYETEFIRFVKKSGIIPENVIVREGDKLLIRSKDGTLTYHSKATAFDIDNLYRSEYIRRRDGMTMIGLKDKEKIKFEDTNKLKETDVLREEDGYISDDCENDIYYDDFMSGNYTLEGAKDIAFNHSTISVHFSYPCWDDYVTFQFNANDKIMGFSREELFKKVMQRFHMLRYLSLNYNVDIGGIDSNNPSGIFKCSLYTDDYQGNGISFLEYDEKNNVWDAICINYP